MNEPDAHILSAVRNHFRGSPPARLGVAVSGGGDSVALLHILTRCFDPGRVELLAATVDHGLRPESAREAMAVRDLADRLGVSHAILRWRGWDGSGNLQDQARRARFELMTDWAKSIGIAVIALGHTADDQAETVLMRLARSSGVNGLSGIPERRTQGGINLVRPLLSLSRENLRGYLRRNGISWSEDPSNDNIRFDRVRARHLLTGIKSMGIDAEVLSEIARNMTQAREALDWYSFLAARDCATVHGGDVVLDVRQFRTLPEEIARRVLVQAIRWIGGGEYPPRRAPVLALLEAVRRGQSGTLGGCRLVHHDRRAWICREYAAVMDHCVPVGAVWDRRWQVRGPEAEGCEIRALGRRGLALCPNWRQAALPHAAAIATPSVWCGEHLLSAPLAGRPADWEAEVIGGSEEFYASLLSH